MIMSRRPKRRNTDDALPPPEKPNPSPLARIGKLLGQFVWSVIVFGFLAVVSGGAPVSWVKFQRNGDRVTAGAQVCVFFVRLPDHSR